MLNIVNQLPAELYEKLVRMIDDDIENVVSSRSRWMESLVDITKNYLGISDDTRLKPWDGASDVFIPMTMISVETAHPRILAGVMGHDETVTATPLGPGSAQSAEKVTQFINWTLHSHSQIGAYPKFDKLLHASELYGRSYSRLYWEKKDNVITRRHTVPRYQQGAGALLRIMQQMNIGNVGLKRLEIPYGQHLNNIMGNRLVRILDMENGSDGTKLTFEYFLDGHIRGGEAFIPTPEPRTTYLHMFLTVEEIVKDAASLHLVMPTDLYHPMDEEDLKTCSFVAERYWVDVEELYQMRQEGLAVIDDDTWQQIVGDSDAEYDYNLSMSRREARPEVTTTAVESDLRDLYARAYGDKETADGYQGVEMLTYHRKLRIDGRARDYIIYYLPEYQTITRVVELGIEVPSGRRPYDSWEFMHATDGSARSLGLGHIVMDLQTIINDIFNKQVDRDDLLTMPFGFYKPTSMTKGQTLRLAPGLLIPTSDPASFNFPNWGRPTGADMPYIQSLMGFVERLTSATNYFQGSAPSQPNAPRTFGATAAIIQEGNVNFNLHIQRYQSSMYSMALDIQGMYRHFMPESMEFLAPGAESVMNIGREELDKEYGYIFKSNAENTNTAIRREMTSIVYQAMMMNPLIQTSVTAMHNLTRRFAHAHGWIEFDKDVPKPAPEMEHAPMSQEEELEAMYHGQNMSVLPIDNHEQHIQVIEQFLTTDTGAQISPTTMAMIMTHLTQHQQMHAMMQRAQMLQPGGGNGPQPGIGSNPAMVAGDQTTQGPPNAV